MQVVHQADCSQERPAEGAKRESIHGTLQMSHTAGNGSLILLGVSGNRYRTSPSDSVPHKVKELDNYTSPALSFCVRCRTDSLPRGDQVGKAASGRKNPQAKGQRFWPLNVGLEASGRKGIKQQGWGHLLCVWQGVSH